MEEMNNPYRQEFEETQRAMILEQTGKDIAEVDDEEKEELVSFLELQNSKKEEEERRRLQELVEKERKDREGRTSDTNFAEFMQSVPDRYLHSDINFYKSDRAFMKEARLIQRLITPRDMGYGVYKMPDAFIYSLENGTGKTYFAYAYAIMRASLGLRCCVVKALHLLNEFKNFEDSTYESKLRRYASYDLLVVDECDKIVGTKFDSTCFFDIIDERYDFLRQTILVANTNDPQGVVGSACLSRIAEDSNGRNIVQFNTRQFRVVAP